MQRVSRSDDTTGAFRIADNASTTNRFDHFFLARRQPSPLFCPDGGLSMSIINLFIKKTPMISGVLWFLIVFRQQDRGCGSVGFGDDINASAVTKIVSR